MEKVCQYLRFSYVLFTISFQPARCISALCYWWNILFHCSYNSGIFGSTSNMAFWCREHLDDLFVNTKFQDGIKERTFKNLSTITQFWKFAETVMIDSMYRNFQDDTHQAFGCMLQDIKLVGAPRLRQVKGRNGSCIVREAFQRSYRACHDLYSPAKEDKEPFGPGIGTAWTYSTAEELRGSSYRGRFSTYSGGGYYEDLSLNRSETIEKLLTLRNNQWITRGTCAIFLDLTLYSANISTIFIVKLVFENTPRGLLTSYDCKIVKLHQLVTSYDFVVAVCELMFVAFIFLFTAKKRVDVMVFKRKCMESVWDGFGLAILMLGYPIICFRIYSYVVIEPQIIQNISEEKFSNFDSYNWYEEYYNFGVVCLFTCAWPMIFKYAGVREFASLLCRYSMEMFTVLFIFFIIIATYIRMICVP
ncbi:polycystic kidney disease 2-like 1 protein isoform X2 [Zootermopsis nevadensis]|uniref:polycystic kidney disease 2-like 1 protein isoform X2 n=1 Tax=Zootermopsis nevadensis TaxID=136037 RepID=UPI000B8EC885|nr:polycystic kidney disease 2-like 1 protein isoform X2 [Zootermopsis nevadensis]